MLSTLFLQHDFPKLSCNEAIFVCAVNFMFQGGLSKHFRVRLPFVPYNKVSLRNSARIIHRNFSLSMTPRIYIQNMGPDIGIVLTANQNMVNLSINYNARRGAKQKKGEE